MNLLTAAPPTTVTIGGKACPINTDFRTCVQFELLTLEDRLTPENVLTMFYGSNWPQPYEEAIQKAVWFYQLGKVEQEKAEAKRNLTKSKRSYDFEIDADALYTSFLTAYNIDLMTDSLHWWAFRELMFGLPDETAFKQRVYYRTGDTSGMSNKQKKHFEAMRKKYSIPERGKIDRKLTLADRDAAMKRYVEQRFEETYGKAKK